MGKTNRQIKKCREKRDTGVNRVELVEWKEKQKAIKGGFSALTLFMPCVERPDRVKYNPQRNLTG